MTSNTISAIVGVAAFGISVSILAHVVLWVCNRRKRTKQEIRPHDHEIDTLDDLLSGRS